MALLVFIHIIVLLKDEWTTKLTIHHIYLYGFIHTHTNKHACCTHEYICINKQKLHTFESIVLLL